MDNRIKQYADNGDLTSLKYIFVDSLDIDPTFDSYEESYNYCKAIPGLLERHQELTPLLNDPAQWTETYWVQLKMDLKKNFSDRRMNHMRKVAKVLLADKEQRILRERHAASAPSPSPTVSGHSVPSRTPTAAAQKVSHTISAEEEQERMLQESERQLEEANQKTRAEREAKERARQAKREELAREKEKERRKKGTHFQEAKSTSPKKGVGIAIAVVAVVVVAIFLLLKQRNPS